jgi:fucokinase
LPSEQLTVVSQRAWSRYAERVAGAAPAAWWTAVVITASSRRQAARYEWEIQRRREQGKLPSGVHYAVVPDPDDRRAGSGGATIHALHALGAARPGWWRDQRVLLIHSGGDSRRLPLYSISGKLFSALPVRTPWGGASTVFDEWMALSTLWVDRLPAGLLVGSGDVILTFEASSLDWTRPGVSGVAMAEPAAIGTGHGVYVHDDQGRVYAFLQKPSIEDVRAAGGLLPGDRVALDTGLLRFCPESAARLAGIPLAPDSPAIDLYQHITMSLTGQWRPRASDAPALHAAHDALKGITFWCSTVEGQFTHVGTTTLFRRLMTEETEFSRLYASHQRLGAASAEGVRSSGVVIDCVFSAGAELGPGSLAMECLLATPVRAGRGAVLHGLEDIHTPVEIPDDIVAHQGSVLLPDHPSGTVLRVYGVGDDPKLAVSTAATWFGRPILDELREHGIDPDMVWPDIPPDQRTFWNARLFPVTTPEEAWSAARWMLRLKTDFSVERWLVLPRVSLAESALWADTAASTVSHSRRSHANWKSIAAALALSGSDIRPMLAHAPGIAPLAEVGRSLSQVAASCEASAPTQAASRYFQASLFCAHAGLSTEAGDNRRSAFRMVERAVAGGVSASFLNPPAPAWLHREVTVSAPPRIDLGGGWSDTPPFCLDWGGTVLNIALELEGEYPIQTAIRTIPEPVIRCASGEVGGLEEYRSIADIAREPEPGDPFLIPRTALRLTGMFDTSSTLASMLERLGGGLEIHTSVNLPMGSGLGTSSILAASAIRAVNEMTGQHCDDQELSDRVMRLEQLMTTGGGWQDQAGGIFRGAKLILSGPGLRQRLRVQPVAWSPGREAEFESLLVLYYTGIRRIARNLLQTVVGSYLARETATVEVLHSIKTLAVEMAYAMQEGDWPYLGQLLDRHWELNKILDPHTTNAPVNTLLERVRPYIYGAKLAGAGGGGFLMLLARSTGAAAELRALLADSSESGGGVCRWRIARDGLRTTVAP